MKRLYAQEARTSLAERLNEDDGEVSCPSSSSHQENYDTSLRAPVAESNHDTRGGTYIIAGLGNPGSEYELTRHNAGFRTLRALAQEVGAVYWKNECGCLTSHVHWKGFVLILAMPQSFMNNSGGPLKRLMETYDVSPRQVIVIHDELDIESGCVRVKYGGGHGGHNGLRSIIDKTASRDFYRIRIGIGRPPGRMPVVDFVLSVPRSDAAEEFEQATRLGAEACLCLIESGLTKAQDTYNRTHKA